MIAVYGSTVTEWLKLKQYLYILNYIRKIRLIKSYGAVQFPVHSFRTLAWINKILALGKNVTLLSDFDCTSRFLTRAGARADGFSPGHLPWCALAVRRH